MGLKEFFLTLVLSDTEELEEPTEETLFPPDAPEVAISEWRHFNGVSNFAMWGDYLDSLFAAAGVYFELECTVKDVPLIGIYHLFQKSSTSDNQREFSWSIDNGSVIFTWYRLGTSGDVKQVKWTGIITDTNEHTILLKYDGSINTNSGLDRCTLLIDGVTQGSKSLSASSGTLGAIFNGTAQLSFGATVTGAGVIGTTNLFNGSVKDLVIRSSGGTVQFSGFNIPPISPPTKGTWNRYMQPVLDGSKNSSAADSCQCTFTSLVDTGTHWYLYYLGSNPLILSDRDQTFLAIKAKSDDVKTGWDKQLSGGIPQVIYGVGAVGKFDAKQNWLRNVLKMNDGTYEAFPIGQSATDTFAMGYSTSVDGITWTRQNSGDAVYSDGATGLVMSQVIFDTDDNKYKLLYSGNGTGIHLAESTDRLTWTKTQTSLLFGEGLRWNVMFKKFNGEYYIWAAKDLNFFSGIADNIGLYKTSDFINFEFMGDQLTAKGATEHALTAGMEAFKKPNGKYAILHTSYKNQIGKSANLGEEFTSIKVAELNRADLPIAGRACTYSYPEYVVKHYPLSKEENSGLDFNEVVRGGTATINSTPVFTPIAAYGNKDLGFVDLTGSQTITDADGLPEGFNYSHFGWKARIELLTTGTHELFRVGNDILVTLESGNLRVRLSSDGVTYQKDYISTTDISKPTNMSYIDNHLYVGFTFNSGTLKLYNDFVEFTTTKTVDTALATVNNSGSSILKGQNATIEMRSVSILKAPTDQQLIDLDI
jgi:hypothetical protein